MPLWRWRTSMEALSSSAWRMTEHRRGFIRTTGHSKVSCDWWQTKWFRHVVFQANVRHNAAYAHAGTLL